MIPVTYLFIITAAVVGGILLKIMPSFILMAKFTYPNAKYNAIGNPYITNEEIQKLLTQDLEDFKNTVNMTRDYHLTGDTVAEVHTELDHTLKDMILMVKDDSPEKIKEFYNIFLYRLDLPLIKRGIKEAVRSQGTEEPRSLDETVGQTHLPETQELLEKLRGQEITEIPRILREYQYPPEVIDLLGRENEDIDFRAVDIALDQAMFTRFQHLRLPRQCQGARNKFIGIYRDILNIKTIIRGKEYGLTEDVIQRLLVGRGRELEDWKLQELLEMDDVPEVISHLEGTIYLPFLRDAIVEYEKDKSISPLEQSLDKCFLHSLRDLSVEYTLNLGVGIRYVMSKEYEIQNLKVISKGLDEKISPETMKKLLVVE